MTQRAAVLLSALGLVLAAAGCARFPDVDAAEPARTGPVVPPRIAPIEPILERPESIEVTSETAKALEEQGAALRERADALKARTD